MRRYHHLGIPTNSPREGECYLEKFDVHVLSYDSGPYGLEWMRYGPACPVPDLVRKEPHVAFEVDDLQAELEGKEMLIKPNSPSPGATVAFIVEGGAPVELLKLEGTAAALGSLFRGPLETIEWTFLPSVEAAGESGWSRAKTVDAGAVRLRIVEYSPGYRADHWCYRGHASYVLEGEIVLEMKDGREFRLSAGDGFKGGGDAENPHRAGSTRGAKVLIVD